MSISVDGFVAGPDQDRDDPVGIGGVKRHEWHWHAGERGHEENAGTRDELMKRRGVYVMGRNMFGPMRGQNELVLDVVPVLLGAGERLFDGVEDPGLQPIEAIHSPHATHIRYRVGR